MQYQQVVYGSFAKGGYSFLPPAGPAAILKEIENLFIHFGTGKAHFSTALISAALSCGDYLIARVFNIGQDSEGRPDTLCFHGFLVPAVKFALVDYHPFYLNQTWFRQTWQPQALASSQEIADHQFFCQSPQLPPGYPADDPFVQCWQMMSQHYDTLSLSQRRGLKMATACLHHPPTLFDLTCVPGPQGPRLVLASSLSKPTSTQPPVGASAASASSLADKSPLRTTWCLYVFLVLLLLLAGEIGFWCNEQAVQNQQLKDRLQHLEQAYQQGLRSLRKSWRQQMRRLQLDWQHQSQVYQESLTQRLANVQLKLDLLLKRLEHFYQKFKLEMQTLSTENAREDLLSQTESFQHTLRKIFSSLSRMQAQITQLTRRTAHKSEANQDQ